MEFQPLNYMFYKSFKSIPKWKRDLMILEAMQKAAKRMDEEAEMASKRHNNSHKQAEIRGQILEFSGLNDPKKPN